MPALRLLGRKWLAASDDLVFPSIFELLFRFVWLVLIALVVEVLYPVTWQCQSEGWQGGAFVRLYLCATLTLQAALMLLLAALALQSARGTITDIDARKMVSPLLLIKVLLVFPETALNIMGTMWMFCEVIQCSVEDKFSSIVIQSIVLFNWVQLGLTVFGLFMVFDPLGSVNYGDMQDTPNQVRHHRKVTGLWSRRFRWAFCWLKRDEHGKEAFQQVAALLSALFRSTDLVPSDVVAGCVLLRVRQKRETREMRRIQMLNDEEPIYTTDVNKIFSETPPWMNLEDALHYLRLSIAAYGWPYVLYRHCFTGFCKLARHLTCCCCRPKNSIVTDDNCCMCNFAGVKYMSNLAADDIIFASFNNRVFELPFCVIADHDRESIVVAVRGSISLRDIFTDFTAGSERFEAEGLPEDTAAHKGMSMGAAKMLKRLLPVLDRAFSQYPHYDLVLTGHSLGAGVAVLVALKLRPRYPHLKVFAFSTPAGLISREAARFTETFVMTVGVGDDLVMRLSVHSIENLRTKIIQTIHATKLPKYRIMLNGFGYALFGVPARDLESTWRRPEQLEAQHSDDSADALLVHSVSTEAALVSRDVFARRFSSARLFTPGRILHIVRRKRMGIEKKVRTTEPTYEMRWACPEDFMELQVMPRMLLDHLPENVHRTIRTVLDERHRYRLTHTVPQSVAGVTMLHGTIATDNLDLFIVVKSAMDHFGHREAIRKTFGRENVPGRTVKTLFFLGIDTKPKSDLQKKIDKEMTEFKDIIQIDFIDNYYNNTIKTMMSFRWLYEHCSTADYYLFSDDDMYISVNNLLAYLHDRQETRIAGLSLPAASKDSIATADPESDYLFTGYVFKSAPQRFKSSKWRVSLEEYQWDKWPAYVTAGAYVLSNKAMKVMYVGSLFVKHFRFDDIYLGIVAKKVGITPTHCSYFHFYKKEFQHGGYFNVIASHGYENHDELLRVWNEENSML